MVKSAVLICLCFALFPFSCTVHPWPLLAFFFLCAYKIPFLIAKRHDLSTSVQPLMAWHWTYHPVQIMATTLKYSVFVFCILHCWLLRDEASCHYCCWICVEWFQIIPALMAWRANKMYKSQADMAKIQSRYIFTTATNGMHVVLAKTQQHFWLFVCLRHTHLYIQVPSDRHVGWWHAPCAC